MCVVSIIISKESELFYEDLVKAITFLRIICETICIEVLIVIIIISLHVMFSILSLLKIFSIFASFESNPL